MDALLLSRLQFAVATGFHFLFVPLTLGLSILIAYMEIKYVKTGEEIYKQMAQFWGKLFFINFALGVVTGISLEFQFGTNWAKYSRFVGDIFGSILAIEATVAFFLESTFVAIWYFGWKKLSPKLHAISICIVAFASSFSAFWIIVANAWMQHPVGYVLKNGRAELSDFFAVITQEFAILQFIHTLSGAYVLAGFFVMGISAYHLLKNQNVEFFKKSFHIGLVFGLIFSFVVAIEGHSHAESVVRIQPVKLAAMEAHWETQKNAPMYIFQVPDDKAEKNNFEMLPIPSLLSILAYGNPDATVKGLKAFPANDRPPVSITFWSFRIMVGLGTLFILLTLIGFILRNKLLENKLYLKVMLLAIPLPYIANEVGWAVAEVGRQPWLVYGLMRTELGGSAITSTQVFLSLSAFILFYTIFGIIAYYLIAKFAAKGPEVLPSEISVKGENSNA